MSDLENRIREVGPWFHNIELAPGVETRKIDPAPGPQPLDHPLKRWKKIEPYLPHDATGMRILDIGCNDGFFSIQMAKRGAAYVAAIELNSKAIERAKFAANELGLSAVDARVGSIYDIDPSLGRFDLVLMLAVFYHLVDPVLALVNLGRISDSVYVETIAADDDENSTMRWGLSTGFDGHDGWIPTTRCVRDLLKYAGFDEVTQIASAADNRPMYYAKKSTSR